MKKIALAFALALALAGCSSSGDGGAAETPAESATEEVTAEQGATEQPAEKGDSGASANDTQVDSAGNPKASQDAFEEALSEAALSALASPDVAGVEISQEEIEEAARCMVERSYDRLSAEFVNAAVTRDTELMPSPEDLEVVLDAAMECR